MTKDEAFLQPVPWTSPGFSLTPFDIVFLPGGHDKGVRQLYDSPVIHQLLGAHLPLTRRPSLKVVAAICHGPLALANASSTSSPGHSALHDVTTTALPGTMEEGIYWITRLALGDYYKTYGAGSDSVEMMIRSKLDDQGKQWRSSLSPAPFVVEDGKYNYLSARFPPDTQALAERAVDLLLSCRAGMETK